jgi:hypothetical protein
VGPRRIDSSDPNRTSIGPEPDANQAISKLKLV